MSYPYSMIAPPVVVALLLWSWRNALNIRPTALKTTMVFMVVLYVIYVGTAVLYDWYLSCKVAGFDLDGDGVFSGEEETPEFRHYSELLTNDVGRVFAPFFGVPYSVLCAAMFWLVLAVADRLGKSPE